MIRTSLRCLVILSIALPANTYANINAAKRYVPNAQIVGTGRLTFWIWDVYDATLYAPNGQWQKNKPYALELAYLRTFSKHDIAQRSIDEIRTLGFNDDNTLKQWQDAMVKVFPDVDEHTTIIGIRDAQGYAIFYKDNTLLGRIDDPMFSQWFFDIWLSPNSSEPTLRKKLLGIDR